MPNHWHLLVQAPSPGELSQFMHRVTWRHAAEVRKSTQSMGLGHLYQGRYRAHLVETERRYLVALRYVEANPVRAGLVAKAEDWRWSSLRERLREARRIVDGPVALPYPRDWVDIVNGIDRANVMPEPEDEVWP
jgi:putative transposase